METNSEKSIMKELQKRADAYKNDKLLLFVLSSLYLSILDNEVQKMVRPSASNLPRTLDYVIKRLSNSPGIGIGKGCSVIWLLADSSPTCEFQICFELLLTRSTMFSPAHLNS
ncbi:hypothetical protein C5167_000168 [Papaver somniferum]|uniref:Uncharacterized protein n=1 Tax=Papaver somniferum TaxID=3469 RepID=A0A4Y7KUI0_PAPSO|nr:hypothetical protein C5167_000168 [Papaver somniferum]